MSQSFSRFSVIVMPLFAISSNAQVIQLDNVVGAFEKISSQPTLYSFSNNAFKIPKGGHSQGIQGWTDKSKEYIAITASSERSSYYITAELGKLNQPGKMVALQKLMDLPYRHAGGCQLIDKNLVVGIEDNQSKEKSEVMMVHLADSGNASRGKTIITRQGSYKRATAGAVGVAQIHNDHYIVAVGDWDSRNIDFYLSRLYSGKTFDSLTTFQAPVDKKWCSYQSINLLTDTTGNLFLIGFCLDGSKNRADLFKVTLEKDGAVFDLVQIRYFKCFGGVGFRYGSGVRVVDRQHFVIYICQRKLKKHNIINIFETLPKFKV